jgi:hypothetical protein
MHDLLRGVLVHDDTGTQWVSFHVEPIPMGEQGLVFEAPQADRAVARLAVSFPLGTPVGVVGVGGVTVSAVDAVAHERALTQLEVQRRAAQAANGPPTNSATNKPH